jgi:transcriptional regulator with XRE-family HTH domain
MKLPKDIADTLRLARADKALSQRELGERTGVPQSHISKIEKGAVDLRVSSLRAIANALDLEIALVPRIAMPAVKSIVGTTPKNGTSASTNFEKRRAHHAYAIAAAIEENGSRPAYRLDDDDDA